MTTSLCESCSHMREIASGKGSRFLLCQLAQDNARFPKYPPQPIIRCEGWSRVVTEPEWLTATDPWSMLQVVQRSPPSERKVRLWNAAICRRFWDHLPTASQAVLAESELLADGLVARGSDDKELGWRANAAVAPLNRQYPTKQFPNAEVRIQHDAAAAVCYAVIPNDLFGAAGYFWDIDPAEKGEHACIIRDIFGNPFRPVSVDPAWLIPTVTTLARIIYDDRAFDQMPDLADALEAAGCTNEEILAHCRLGNHVRGCWVVDLLLRKE